MIADSELAEIAMIVAYGCAGRDPLCQDIGLADRGECIDYKKCFAAEE